MYLLELRNWCLGSWDCFQVQEVTPVTISKRKATSFFSVKRYFRNTHTYVADDTCVTLKRYKHVDSSYDM